MGQAGIAVVRTALVGNIENIVLPELHWHLAAIRKSKGAITRAVGMKLEANSQQWAKP